MGRSEDAAGRTSERGWGHGPIRARPTQGPYPRRRALSPAFAAAAVALIALVAACSPPPPAVAPIVVAPMPKAYTCDQQRALADEFAAMPAGSMAKQVIVDYGRERDQLRAVHGLPRPAACP